MRFGWGAVFEGKKAHGYLSPDERITSSGERELVAIHRALQSFPPQIKGKRVRISDNTNAVAMVDHGSSKILVQSRALDIFWLCHRYCIFLSVDWKWED